MGIPRGAHKYLHNFILYLLRADPCKSNYSNPDTIPNLVYFWFPLPNRKLVVQLFAASPFYFFRNKVI